MSEAAIRQKIKTILMSVADIGVVHDYRRNAAGDAAFIALFSDVIAGQRQYRGWQIYRESATESSNSTVALNNYVIEGYLGIRDAAETGKAFDLLIEAIRAAFRADTTLHDAGNGHGPVQVPVINEMNFGGVLCHHARLTITINDYVT